VLLSISRGKAAWLCLDPPAFISTAFSRIFAWAHIWSRDGEREQTANLSLTFLGSHVVWVQCVGAFQWTA
jgi:hypothetical protein